MTCSAPAAATSSSSRLERPGDRRPDASRRATGPSGANRTRCGSVPTGIDKRGGQRIDRVVARDARRGRTLPRFVPAASPLGRVKKRARCVGDEEREHQIAPRVHVVHGDAALRGIPAARGSRTAARHSAVRAPPPAATPAARRRESGSRARRSSSRGASSRTTGPPMTRPARPWPTAASRGSRSADATTLAAARRDGNQKGEHGEARHEGRQRRRARRAPRSSGCTRRSRTTPADSRPTSVRSMPDERQSTTAMTRRASGTARTAPAPRAPSRRCAAAAPPDRAARRRPRHRPLSSQSRAPPSIAANMAPIDTDAAPGHEIDLDARLVQRPQHAGVIRAGGAGPVSTSAVRRRVEYCRSGESEVTTRPSLQLSSWMVSSLTTSKRLLPFGVVTVTSSPSSFVEERAADRRGRRDEPLVDIGVFGHDQLSRRSSGRRHP